MNDRSQVIRPGPAKPTIAGCVEGMKVDLGLAKVKKARKQRVAGYKCNWKEKHDRPEITKRLRNDGWKIRFVEPSGWSKDHDFSLGDAWMSHAGKRQSGWGEYKSSVGKLKPKQKLFRDDCKRDGINYWVIRLDGDGYSMTDE